MTTEAMDPQVQQEAAWEAAPYVQFGVPGVPFSAIRVPLHANPVEAAAWADRALKMAVYLAKKYAEAFPEAQREPERQEPQRQNNQRQQQGRRPQGGGGQRRGGGGGGQGTSRTERFQKYEGESCDVCGGDVGVYPRTGNMQTDKLVCLGKCKDGDYVHTVRWLDEDEMPF